MSHKESACMFVCLCACVCVYMLCFPLNQLPSSFDRLPTPPPPLHSTSQVAFVGTVSNAMGVVCKRPGQGNFKCHLFIMDNEEQVSVFINGTVLVVFTHNTNACNTCTHRGAKRQTERQKQRDKETEANRQRDRGEETQKDIRGLTHTRTCAQTRLSRRAERCNRPPTTRSNE